MFTFLIETIPEIGPPIFLFGLAIIAFIADDQIRVCGVMRQYKFHILMFAVGWTLAALWGDLFSSHSDIRNAYYKWQKEYEIVSFVPASRVINGAEFIQPTVKIRFPKDIEANIVFCVDSFIPHKRNYVRQFCEEIEEKRTYIEGNETNIILASIPQTASYNPEWNALNSKGDKHSLLKHTAHIATLKIGKYAHKFYIDHLNRKAGAQGYVYILEENVDIWNVE